MTKNPNSELLKKLEENTTDQGLLSYAREYYSSYEIIQHQHPQITEFFAVKFYLLCHSLELAMKAWLRNKGSSYRELKGMNHDLKKMLDILHDRHHLSFDCKSRAIIEAVNQYYSRKEFEYFIRGFKSVPEITELARVVHLFISKAIFCIYNGSNPQKL